MSTGKAIFMAGLAGIFWKMSQATASSNLVQSQPQVSQLVLDTLKKPRLSDVDPIMIQAMIKIESNNNPLAARYEPHLGEASLGLMQVLPSTAKWLASDMGYTYYGRIIKDDQLLEPEIAVYFGAAFVDWLKTWKGKTRSEQWIVESYNGGPNNSNSQTQNHWRKYQEAKAKILRG